MTLTWTSAEQLQQEFDRNLSKGRTFVSDAGELGQREPCILKLIHPTTGQALELDAEAVWSDPSSPAAGFELLGAEQERLVALKGFLTSASCANQANDLDDKPHASAEAETKHLPPGRDESATRVRNIYDKIRQLSTTEQQNMARKGTLAERVALERCYAGAVWEGLLQNPQLTVTEVAKIAKKGNLTQPLLSLIVSNNAWLAVGEVQRALLGNPRLSGAHVTRVLRAMSRRDLARVPQQPGYRLNVRSAAKQLLKKAQD